MPLSSSSDLYKVTVVLTSSDPQDMLCNIRDLTPGRTALHVLPCTLATVDSPVGKDNSANLCFTDGQVSCDARI